MFTWNWLDFSWGYSVARMNKRGTKSEKAYEESRASTTQNTLPIGQKELEFLRDFKGRLLKRYSDRVKLISLFGSRATRRARNHSDYDVFIMVDKKDRQLTDGIFDLAYDIYVESDLTIDISPVIMTEEYFQNRLSQERKIAEDIQREGIPF
jgi:predicted nucleotidyltransferase